MSAEGNELLTLNYDRILDHRETKLAWFVVFGDRTVPLPKSCVEDIRETAHELVMPRWLVEAKELEGYAT